MGDEQALTAEQREKLWEQFVIEHGHAQEAFPRREGNREWRGRTAPPVVPPPTLERGRTPPPILPPEPRPGPTVPPVMPPPAPPPSAPDKK